jgi:hypothetical protein
LVAFQQGDVDWQAMDSLARHFGGTPLNLQGSPAPAWVVTPENVGDEKKYDGEYVLVDGFKEQYTKVWGVS